MLSTFFVAVLAVTAVNGHGIKYQCRTDHVLAVTKQSDQRIDMFPTVADICNQKRECVYTQGMPCVNKGQYISAVNDDDGRLTIGCCQYVPPVEDHQDDDCHDLILEAEDMATITSSAARPSLFGRPKPSNGGGGENKHEEIVLEYNNATRNVHSTLYIKSITKIHSKGVEGYSVKCCTPQCGRSSTQRPSTPRQHSEEKHAEHKPHIKFLEGHKCFSGDMTVETQAGRKRMDQVKTGDRVMVLTSPDSKPIYEPIEWLYHRNPAMEAEFITVTTKSNRILQLSPNHLIPVIPCSNGKLSSENLTFLADSYSVFARRLKIGSCIATLINKNFAADPVISISLERKTGIYSPITGRGTIVVNGVYVSCYSSVENHAAQKVIHSGLIALRRTVASLWKWTFGSTLLDEDSGIPAPLKIILKMAQLVVPSNVYRV